jgi:hypothetical protein
MVWRTLLAIGFLLIVAGSLRAQYGDLPLPSQQPLATQPVPQDSYPPPVVPPGPPYVSPAAGPGPPYVPPMPEYTEPLHDPPWCASPYRSSAWRLGIDLIPTLSHVSEAAFGDWDHSGSLALRLHLGYEEDDGYGMRLQFWGYDNEQDTAVGDVDLTASTFYFDFYKRFFIEHGELMLGAGAAGAGMEYDVKAFNDRARLTAGGLSVFGEGFYPFCRFKKTDIGSVARARFALLSGKWDDHGSPFINDTDHDMTTIIELAWGLELRHRFGRGEEQFWYVSIVPEIQRWESSSLPDPFDPGFEGTSINFGLAW